MTNRYFILSLDIDETLINDKGDNDIHFNGSNLGNDASTWLDLIEYGQNECQQYGVEFVLQIITAKQTGTCDITTDGCHQHLFQHLNPRRQNGQTFITGKDYQYLVRRHLEDEQLDELFDNFRIDTAIKKSPNGTAYQDTRLFLPSIHICLNNNTNADTDLKKTSKALVLEHIRQFFGISEDLLLHVDNSRLVMGDLKSGANGLTPPFHYIDAYELERLKGNRAHDERNEHTFRIINETKSKITELLDKTFKKRPHPASVKEIYPPTQKPKFFSTSNISATVLDEESKKAIIHCIEETERHFHMNLSVIDQNFIYGDRSYLPSCFHDFQRLFLNQEKISLNELENHITKLFAENHQALKELGNQCNKIISFDPPEETIPYQKLKKD